jgi:hypothetical protein
MSNKIITAKTKKSYNSLSETHINQPVHVIPEPVLEILNVSLPWPEPWEHEPFIFSYHPPYVLIFDLPIFFGFCSLHYLGHLGYRAIN